MRRAALYIDGFNFYYGVRNYFKQGQETRGFSLSGLVWCDFRALVERHFLDPDTQLHLIRYFTAPVTEGVEAKKDEHARYELWLRAASKIRGLKTVFGYYRSGTQGLREEKETDVNIAVEMLLDGFAGNYDTAYLLSGDTDQIPAVAAAAFRLKGQRRVRVLVPPAQSIESWQRHYLSYMQQLKARFKLQQQELRQVDVKPLTEEVLANSLLRYDLPGAECPHYWRLPQKYLEEKCKAEWRPDIAQGQAAL
ncbi:MAG: NYN domain-containing protein [Bryobacteraceae bacterium]|jgi:hypothetical protein